MKNLYKICCVVLTVLTLLIAVTDLTVVAFRLAETLLIVLSVLITLTVAIVRSYFYKFQSVYIVSNSSHFLKSQQLDYI